VVVELVMMMVVVVDVLVAPRSMVTAASTSSAISSHACVCAMQSPLALIVSHLSRNLVLHLMSLASLTASPVFCAAAYAFSWQATFRATAFVTPESQLDCACATESSPSDRARNPTTETAPAIRPPNSDAASGRVENVFIEFPL